MFINQIDAANNEENDDSINGYEIPINKTDHQENESMPSCIAFYRSSHEKEF